MTRHLRRSREWFALGIGAALTIWTAVMWARAVRSPSFFPDFAAFYAEAALVVDHGAASAYDLVLQRQYQSVLTSSWAAHPAFLPYVHPPYFTLLLTPLTLFGYKGAYIVWAVLDVLLLTAALAIMAGAAGFSRLQAAVVILLATGFTPVYVALVEGQSDMIMLLPLVISYWAWRSDRHVLAGGMAGLAMVKPNMLLLIPLLFAARRSWPAVAGFAGVAAILGAVSLVAFGPGSMVAYARLVGGWGVHGEPGFPVSNQVALSARAPLDALLGDTWSLVGLACLAVGLVVIVVRSRPDAPLDFALAVGGSVALSPYQNLHDLSLLVLPGAAALATATRSQVAVLVLAFAAVELTRPLGPWSACIGVLMLASVLVWQKLHRQPDLAVRMARDGPASRGRVTPSRIGLGRTKMESQPR